MTDWENPKITIEPDPDPPRIGPPPPPARWRRAAGILVRSSTTGWNALRAALLQGVPLAAVAAVVWVVVAELRSHRVEIAPIGVPPAFAQQGVTPEVTARRLLDEIDLIQRSASTTMRRADAALAGEAVDFSVPGVGLSLSSVVQTLRRLLGVPSPRVTGEITLVGQVPSLRLRLAGHEPVTVTAHSGDDPVLSLVRSAARDLLLRTNPFMVVSHDYEHNPDPQSVLDLARRIELSGLGPAETRVRLINLQGLIFHEKLNQPDRAIVEFRRAIIVDARASFIHLNLGNVLRDLGRREEAEASYRVSLQLDPREPFAHAGLAYILGELGRLQDAARSYRAALRLNPRYVLAHNNLGAVLHDLGQHEESEASYREALRLDPQHAIAHSNLGRLLRDAGRREDAEASYREALRLDPANDNTHHNLALLLEDTERLSEALGHARQALALRVTPETERLVRRLELKTR